MMWFCIILGAVLQKSLFYLAVFLFQNTKQFAVITCTSFNLRFSVKKSVCSDNTL